MEHYVSNDKWCVYYHKNRTNGKYYVGITKNTEQRWRSNGICYKNCTYLWHAIQKYGWDDFDHAILITDLSKECANLIQIQLIAKFNLRDKSVGYNISRGGDGGPVMSGEDNPFSRTVYQYSLDGYFIKEWKTVKSAQKALNLTVGSICNAASGRSHQSGGFQWTYKKVEKMPDYNGYPVWLSKGKPRICKISFDGEILNKYDDYHHIQNCTPSQCNRIMACCCGNALSAYGYLWVFESDCDDETIQKRIHRKKHRIPSRKQRIVCVYDRFGKLIETLKINDVAKQYNISPGAIRSACVSKTHCLYGLYFYFYDETKGVDVKITIASKYRAVLQFDNGKLMKRYSTLKDARIEFGDSVKYGINGKTHRSHGYTWLYEDQYHELKDQLGLEEIDLGRLDSLTPGFRLVQNENEYSKGGLFMVYATGGNRTLCSVRPVKTKRREGEFAKNLREFATTHKVSVQTSPSGEIIVKTIKIQK